MSCNKNTSQDDNNNKNSNPYAPYSDFSIAKILGLKDLKSLSQKEDFFKNHSAKPIVSSSEQDVSLANFPIANSSPAILNSVSCYLENEYLWSKFHELGTEMIITKTGRRMFPSLRVLVKIDQTKLEPEFTKSHLFHVLLDAIPIDDQRYRYAYHRSAWLVAGKAEITPRYTAAVHHEGPFEFERFTDLLLSFDKVKLTNSDTHDKNGYILLNSMHRYQPRIHVVAVPRTSKFHKSDFNKKSAKKSVEKINFKNSSPDDIESFIRGNVYKSFLFEETMFTAVTAYQNQLITRLKIESNPFAKGFRETSSAVTDKNKQFREDYAFPGGFGQSSGLVPSQGSLNDESGKHSGLLELLKTLRSLQDKK